MKHVAVQKERLGGFKDFPWRISYRTGTLKEDGTPLDILHDFYIPALSLSVRYDRMAGYFRSSSLAAASQGFSAFVGSRGKMRLVVGADLDPQDVLAVLRGSEQRLASVLAGRVEITEQWPKEVVRGVELLAWMVAHGYLDVKVAFRVHTITKDPLPQDSTEDGYVHMKWAIFQDGQGNRIYITGSLNESRTALSLNAENIDVHCDWRGETELLRVQEAERDFQALWEDNHPAFRVLDIPEAVKEKLIRISQKTVTLTEIDGTSAAPKWALPPPPLERVKFAIIKDAPQMPGGRYVGMETAPITPWPHQEVVARRILDTWPCSYLLCDEVGLGKTIEAGLVIRSLHLSRLAKRVLICAPASLTRQWQREMATKFFLPFALAVRGNPIRHKYIFPSEEEKGASSLYEPGLLIVSTGLLVRKERIDDLNKARSFDVVLVDEAHYARRKNPTEGTRGTPKYGTLYRTIAQRLQPKTQSILLATATPMQLDPVEAADLLSLSRRAGPYLRDPGLMRAYYECLGRLLSGSQLSDSEWKFLVKAVASLKTEDPFHWDYISRAIINGRYRLAIKQWLENGRVPKGSDIKGIQRLVFLAAPLSRVMLRHTRALLEVYRKEGKLGANLAQRVILPMPRIVFTDQERTSYQLLEEYCKELGRRLSRSVDQRKRSMVGLMLSFLRLRFASSLFAIRETLRRRLQKVKAALERLEEEEELDRSWDLALDELEEDLEEEETEGPDLIGAFIKGRSPADLGWEKAKLEEMLKYLEDLSGKSSKMAELLRFLDRRRLDEMRIRPTVVFTKFYDTLKDIVERLLRAHPKILLGTYSGQGGQYMDPVRWQLVSVDREEVKRRFLRGEVDVLVCTDAAAEGLNLQKADALVNFDLPWNPMKVEQRIGRIDRIGQENKKVYVLNLCYADSVEEVVYERLLKRLGEAGLVVGTQQMSLLPVKREEFMALAEGELSPQELEKRALERAELAKKRWESMELQAEELYGIYTRDSERKKSRQTPVTLESIWEVLSSSSYLKELGSVLLPETGEKVMKLNGIPGIPDGTLLTCSREIFEKGIPGQIPLHFASYGDPIFDALVEHMTSFDLPAWARRIKVQGAQSEGEFVGYVVATVSPSREKWKLVKSIMDLRHLVLDEDAHLDDLDVEEATQELLRLARQELDTINRIKGLEDMNENRGRLQVLLDLAVAMSLLQERQAEGKAQELLWKELPMLEQSLDDDQIRIRLPREVAQQIQDIGLYDPVIPSAGQAYLDVPKPLIVAAIDAAYRLARAMKVKKTELSTAEFLKRLEKEMERFLAQGVLH